MADAKKEEVKATEPVVIASTTAPTVTPAPKMKELILDIKNPTKVKFIIANTGEITERVIHETQFSLSKGMLYWIPLTDKTIKLDNFMSLKIKGNIAEKIRILNIEDGNALIEPIVHGTIISDKMLVGIVF